MAAIPAPAVHPKSWHWSSIPKGMSERPLAVGCALICFMVAKLDRDLLLPSDSVTYFNIGIGCFNTLLVFGAIQTENQKMTAKARVYLMLERVLTRSKGGEPQRTMLSGISPEEAFRYNQVRWNCRFAEGCSHLYLPADERLARSWFGLREADVATLNSLPILKGATFAPESVKALLAEMGWRVETDERVEAAVLMTALKMVRSTGPHKVDLEDALDAMAPSEIDRRGSHAVLYREWFSTNGSESSSFEAPEVAAAAVVLLKRGAPITPDREARGVVRQIWKSRWNLTREEQKNSLYFDLNRSLAKRPYHTTQELSITDGTPSAQEVSLQIALQCIEREQKEKLVARGLWPAHSDGEVDPRFVVLVCAFAKAAHGQEVDLNNPEAIKGAMPDWCTQEAVDLAPAAVHWFRERARQ